MKIFSAQEVMEMTDEEIMEIQSSLDSQLRRQRFLAILLPIVAIGIVVYTILW